MMHLMLTLNSLRSLRKRRLRLKKLIWFYVRVSSNGYQIFQLRIGKGTVFDCVVSNTPY